MNSQNNMVAVDTSILTDNTENPSSKRPAEASPAVSDKHKPVKSKTTSDDLLFYEDAISPNPRTNFEINTLPSAQGQTDHAGLYLAHSDEHNKRAALEHFFIGPIDGRQVKVTLKRAPTRQERERKEKQRLDFLLESFFCNLVDYNRWKEQSKALKAHEAAVTDLFIMLRSDLDSLDGPVADITRMQAQRTTDFAIKCWEEGQKEYQGFIDTLKALNVAYNKKAIY